MYINAYDGNDLTKIKKVLNFHGVLRVQISAGY